MVEAVAEAGSLALVPVAPEEPADEELAEDEPSCRICWRASLPDDPLLQPCKCSGSLRWVHKSCNAEWLSQSKRATCEVSGLINIDALQHSLGQLSATDAAAYVSACASLHECIICCA